MNDVKIAIKAQTCFVLLQMYLYHTKVCNITLEKVKFSSILLANFVFLQNNETV